MTAKQATKKSKELRKQVKKERIGITEKRNLKKLMKEFHTAKNVTSNTHDDLEMY